jgi:hypothetical protein
VVTAVRVQTAQLAGGDNNADRVFVTDNAVIVLDGASAFLPVDVDPGTYAGTLGEIIARELRQTPLRPLVDVLRQAIEETADKLHIIRGAGPSSTVSILRDAGPTVDLLVLGDSPIHYGTDTTHHVLTDDRLSAVAPHARQRYRERLQAGHGYDDDHRASLAALQRVERDHRNRPGGYWIAEADPAAAGNAITVELPRDAITWAVLATDGAADLIDHFDMGWRAIADYDEPALGTMLDRIHRWETAADPDGHDLPRSKRHDDKTVAAITAGLD